MPNFHRFIFFIVCLKIWWQICEEFAEMPIMAFKLCLQVVFKFSMYQSGPRFCLKAKYQEDFQNVRHYKNVCHYKNVPFLVDNIRNAPRALPAPTDTWGIFHDCLP